MPEPKMAPQKPAGEAPKSKNNTALIVVLVIVGVLVLISVGGCIACRACANTVTKGIEEGIEEASGVDIDTKDGEVSVKTKDGDYEAKTGEFPEDFPSSLPVYDDATVEASSSYKSDDETIFSVTMGTDDSYDSVVNFFKNELRNAGWIPLNETESSSGDGKITTFTFSREKSPGAGWITVSEDNSDLTIAYSITVEK